MLQLAKKIGPLSLDLIVACKIYEIEYVQKEPVEFSKLITELEGLVSQSSLSPLLSTLEKWEIILVEYGQTSSGRAGRRYHIADQSRELIKRLYEMHWDRIKRQRKGQRRTSS